MGEIPSTASLKANRSYLSLFDLAIFCAMNIKSFRLFSSIWLRKGRNL